VFLAAPARAADLFVDLLSRERFDFSWVSLPSVHLGGHLLWDPSTLDAQDAGSDDRARLESGLTDVYQRADEALGRMIEVLPAGSEAIVFSGLGMGPNTTRSDLLPEMVRRVLSGADRRDDDRPADAIWRLRARIPRVFRRAFNRTVPGVLVREAVARAHTRGLDWRRTQAFALPGDHFGYVRFNLRGREREGIVDPSETDALAEELATGLGTFSDDDGAPAIAAVHRPQIELSGRRLELLPDLVVAWSGQPSTGLTGVVSPRYGRVERREAGTGRTGNHWPGMWVATPPGETDEVQVGRSPQLIDLAATAAARFGVLDGLPGASLLGIHDGP
jgi:hypothetical protein